MCIQNRIDSIRLQKEALDAQIVRLEKLEAATTPVKNLLAELLANYAVEAPEDLAAVWAEVLAIGTAHNLSAQPLAQIATEPDSDTKVEEATDSHNLINEVAAVASAETLGQPGSLEDVGEIVLSQEELTAFNRLSDSIADNLSRHLDQIMGAPEPLGDRVLEETGTNISTERDDLSTESTEFMMAITLRQPWASAIAAGKKRYETRSWPTSHRGPIAIHAGKKFDEDLALMNLLKIETNNIPLGVVVAVADVTDCIQMNQEFIDQQSSVEQALGVWKLGNYAWKLENVRRIESDPVTGKQGLWKWWNSENDTTWASDELKKEKDNAESDYELEKILCSHGFFMPDLKLEGLYDSEQKYEEYRGWETYFTVVDKCGVTTTGELKSQITDIGLNNPTKGFWTADADTICEEDSTFPQNFTEHDAIVAWTRKVIDEVVAIAPTENTEFPDPTPEQIAEELVLDDEPTKLQELLKGGCNFTFEELGVSIAIESVFTEQEVQSEDKENEAGDPATEEIEEARITATNATGKTLEYYVNAETFIYQYRRNEADFYKAAKAYAHCFLRDLEKEAAINERLAQWKAGDDAQQSINSNEFTLLDCRVVVHPQYANSSLAGATFQVSSLADTEKILFSRSLTKAEIAARDNTDIASDMIRDYIAKEAARKEKEANPYAREEDKFVELVKLTPAVGYLKRKDNGELLAAFAAFANRDSSGQKTLTFAKVRAKKWAEYLGSTYESCGWKVHPPRNIARMEAEPGAKQQFSYEIEITGAISIGQLTLLAKEDFSLLPGEMTPPVQAAPAKVPPQTQKIFKVVANSYQLATGSEEEMRDRFKQELLKMGGAQMSVSLLCGSTIREAYCVSDFEFLQTQDFDDENPEYEVKHYLVPDTDFSVWRKVTMFGAVDLTAWKHSANPSTDFQTKESAAVDAVRQLMPEFTF